MKFQKQTYTQTPNSLFTEMKDMDECELKVVMLICRYTFGYHRDEVKLSTRRIADEIGMNTASVQKGADAAVERGLIEKVIDGNKTTLWRAVVDDSNSDTQVIQNLTRGDSNSESLSSIKESNKEKNSLSSKDYEQVNAKVDAMITNSARADWTGREAFRPDHYPLVDWYHKVTGQDCPMSKRKDWLKAVSLWSSNALTVADLQAAYDMDISWRGVFTSPNQLTEKAIALKAQKQAQPKEMTRLL